MADQHHNFGIGGGGPLWSRTTQGMGVDWLRDRLDGKPLRHPGISFVNGSDGPNAASVQEKRHWYEEGR